MNYPNLNEENKLRKKGYRYIVGLDEVGRGPLAGPVVAVAVIIKNPIHLKIKDSKQLSFQKREEIFECLKDLPDVEWGIGRVSEKVIDKINILEASKLAMKKAVRNLEKKVSIDCLILDGNFKIDIPYYQKSIIKGDEKVFSCALASIIAKVSRDRMMKNYHKKYPEYGFDRHKGYPTELHRDMLKEYGFCKIHRKSFRCG